jgi:hypothetical protein
MTYLIEQMSGMPAPARAENDDPGMTVEEFQRQRAERPGSTQPHSPSQRRPRTKTTTGIRSTRRR